VRPPVANEVGDGRADVQDLVRRDPPAAAPARQQPLRDDRAQRGGHHGPDLVLLLGGKDVEEAAHRRGGVARVQRAQDEVAGLRRDDRRADRLEVAQWTRADAEGWWGIFGDDIEKAKEPLTPSGTEQTVAIDFDER